jgi:hypothetical protein
MERLVVDDDIDPVTGNNAGLKDVEIGMLYSRM